MISHSTPLLVYTWATRVFNVFRLLSLDRNGSFRRASREMLQWARSLLPSRAAAGKPQTAELVKLTNAGRAVSERGMVLHAGHGLTYHNVEPIAAIAHMSELNIGHSIVSRALFVD